MLKKRIIFTLLYDNGHFVLSRNFRLQKVGDITWLQRNYNFSHIAFYIDELIILDVSRGERNFEQFCAVLRELTNGCFAPIAAGGGVNSVEEARKLLHSGADKVVLNSALFHAPDLLPLLAQEFGQQCIVGSIDVKHDGTRGYRIHTRNGSNVLELPPAQAISQIPTNTVGELYVNSINNDGTGQGYDFELLNLLPSEWSSPIILAGGVGNSNHLLAGLRDPRVDAVATAHLFNFVGDGLQRARASILAEKISLARWASPAEIGMDQQWGPSLCD